MSEPEKLHREIVAHLVESNTVNDLFCSDSTCDSGRRAKGYCQRGVLEAEILQVPQGYGKMKEVGLGWRMLRGGKKTQWKWRIQEI